VKTLKKKTANARLKLSFLKTVTEKQAKQSNLILLPNSVVLKKPKIQKTMGKTQLLKLIRAKTKYL